VAEIVVPNEMAKQLGVQPLRLRNWLRAERANGHPLLAGHVHRGRWEFTRPDADRLMSDFRAFRDGRVSMGSSHPSASEVQRRAERAIRAQLARRLRTRLRPETLVLAGGGAAVQVDAVAPDGSVIAEIFARQGPLKAGQQKKAAIDALKLITIGRERPEARLVLAFADEAAAAYATGGGWLAQALRTWSVSVEVVEIAPALRAEIRAAQRRQRMVNVSDVADDVALERTV
jgi:hypothetical protein